ncbi:MAG: alpha/beta hydrolase, partial [Acidimicrobiia bacterium]|nr:alpha/beta hydrolase [Acidimicrobiia bacterium]
GESLGAAVAIGLAAEQPPAALVLRSPFTSLVDVARVHYTLPLGWLIRDHFPSESTIEGLDVPTLVVAGSADTIVPVSQSRRIHAAAPEPKELVIVEEAGHNDFALLAGAELIESVTYFVRRHVAPDR